MKLGKILIIVIILSFFTPLIILPQENLDDIKITTTNIMIYRIFQTRMGLVIEYIAGSRYRRTYFPNSFIMNKTVIKIVEDDYSITPQMNVVYKNGEPYKVKLYIPPVADGYIYQLIEFMPDDLIEKFKATTKLEIDLKDVE